MNASKSILSDAFRLATGSLGGLMLATASHAAVVMTQAASAEMTANGSTVNQSATGGSADLVAAVVNAPNITFQPTDSTGGAYAAGFPSGYFYTGAYGAGQFEARSVFTREWTITNDTAVQQAYTFNFHVPAGELLTQTTVPAFTAMGDDGYARYLIQVVLNGATDLYTSGVDLFGYQSTVTQGSLLTGAYQTQNLLFKRYTWNDTSVSLALGLLAPGQSLSLQYTLEAQAFGNYGFITNSNCLMLTDTGIGLENFCTGQSKAFIADPNSIDNLPAPSFTAMAAPVQAVPEPGTWALLGLGLGLVSAVRRRRAD